MKKFLLLFLFSCLLLGCVPEDHVLEIEIVNNTSQPVEDVKVLTAGETVTFEVDVIPAGQSINHTLQVAGNSVDGNYTFRFTRNTGKQESATGKYLEEGEGYLKKTLVFAILEDAVNVSQKTLEVE